ncbi:MAG: efflux RND transporter periplasmic adaptor subunit [Candidatus Ventricola sp.]
MKKKRKWIKWVILAAVVLLIVAWMMLFNKTSESIAYSQMMAQQGDLTTYFNFDGTVRAKRSQTITAQAADTVKTVYVAQNAQVKKDDRLYKTESGLTVRAGIDGEVTGLYVHEGDVIAAGEKTAEIMDLDDLEVRLSVDEYDVAAMIPGTPIDVTVLALDRSFSGTVTSLDKNGTASGDLSYYTAYADLEDAQGVYPGMQVSAKVLRSQALGATILKTDAIQFDDYNRPYVLMYSADGKDTVRVSVSVGVSDGVYCEITEGLKPGDTVLVPSGMSMQQIMEQMRDARMGK